MKKAKKASASTSASRPKSRHKPILRRTSWRRLAAALGIFTLICLIGMFAFGAVYQHQHRHDPVEFGVSFSKRAALDLGVPWKNTYIALLDDLKFRKLRLMSYWDAHERRQGTYNFQDLDWQMDEAAKRGATVGLSIGLRQPRWPECHQPLWAFELSRDAWQTALFSYIQTVVERYRNHPALGSWHLENEFYNSVFGECDDFSSERLQKEMDLVRAADPKHPIITTLADQLTFPSRGPRPDIYATSMYLGNYVKFWGYFRYPLPTHFYSAQAFFIKLLYGKDIYIHELQLEPWGPRPTRTMSLAEQDHYLGIDRMHNTIKFGLGTGMKEMYLWGGEWWYWRKTHFNDHSIWETVRQETQHYDGP